MKISRPVIAGAGFLLFEAALMLFADRPVAEYAKSLDQSAHGLIDFFRSITDLGKSLWYLWPCGIATLFCAFLSRGTDVPQRYRNLFGYIGVRTFFLFVTIALSGIVSDIIKPIAGRSRPILWLRDGIFAFDPFNAHGFLWNSMPSGHATTAFTLVFALSQIYPRMRPVWFLYGTLIALSRIMVNAHYLSDACAGIVLAWLTVKLFAQYGMAPLSKIIFPIDSVAEKS